MDLSTITVQQFKNLFARDFPYLPVWFAGGIYNIGSLAYYAPTQLFYTSKIDGNATLPIDLSKWDRTTADVNDYILDADVARAMLEAKAMFNQALFGDDDNITMMFLYLTAHFLINDTHARMSPMAGASYAVSSRTVGNVSETYAIPDVYKSNPQFAFLSQSPYGTKYLAQLIPGLGGAVFVVGGATTP